MLHIAPDLIWCETSEPNLKEAQHFADEIHAHYPGKIRRCG